MVTLAINILTGILTFIYVTIVLFIRRGWLLLTPFVSENKVPRTRVTVLIAARNEEDNIGLTIDDILAQTYPQALTELIIVDDHSTDRTADIIRSYADRGVKLIQMSETQVLNSYKKKAIAEAINRAQGELIVTTDADCRMAPGWLSSIVAYYERYEPKMISSPVAYHQEHSFFERLQTLEFLYLIGLGAASIGNKIPSTCNGANLAYRRDVFFELGGFKGIDDLASGDDELLLHKVVEAYPDGVGFCMAFDAIVYTTAKPTLKEFIRQRKRWASKSTRYKNKSIVALGVVIWLFNVFMVISGIGLFFDHSLWHVFVYSLIFKFFGELAFLVPVTRFIRRPELLIMLPVLTVCHIVYMVYIGIMGNTGKYVWKDRLVN